MPSWLLAALQAAGRGRVLERARGLATRAASTPKPPTAGGSAKRVAKAPGASGATSRPPKPGHGRPKNTDAAAAQGGAPPGVKELGGPKGPEPTRFGE